MSDYANSAAFVSPEWAGAFPACSPSRASHPTRTIACRDARLTVEDVLGLRTGDAHIIRHADGLASDDAIRSFVIEHTGCGMLTFRDDDVLPDLVEKTGVDVGLSLYAFDDLDANLQAQVERIRAHPWINDVPVHGLVHEFEIGRLRQVA